MTVGLIIIALVTLLAVLSHRRTRFEQRIFKNVPLNDWLTLVVFPPVMFIGWAIIIKNIIYRPNINLITIDDFDLIAVMILFMIYAFVGNGLHFTSKIIWRYLPSKDRNKHIYKVNEMFHNKLSHYLVYVTSDALVFLMAVIEINHPLSRTISGAFVMLLIGVGAIFGVSAAKSIFYTNQWFGGYNRPLSLLCTLLLIGLVVIYKTFGVSLYYYPISLFIVTVYATFIGSFIFRQFLIFTRLNNKRKLRFLAKIFSV